MTIPDNRRNFKHNLEDWEVEINSLEIFFNKIDLPTQSVKLDTCTTIKDIRVFLENHFATVKANIGNPKFYSYLSRLQKLRDKLR
jgi:hypothetical protein